MQQDGFLDTEQAGGDQQHVGEMKPILSHQKQDGACACLAASVSALPVLLPIPLLAGAFEGQFFLLSPLL